MAPKAPKRPGYTFIGWYHDLTNITTDLIVNPIFKKYPTANASNIKVPVGTQIDVLKQIEAIDADGNAIHKGITIIRNPVNFNKPGKYTVTYQVEDQWGGMVTGSFIVEILEENDKIVDTSGSLSSTLYSVLVFICLVSMLSIKKSEKKYIIRIRNQDQEKHIGFFLFCSIYQIKLTFINLSRKIRYIKSHTLSKKWLKITCIYSRITI